jgi:hypothetical protein
VLAAGAGCSLRCCVHAAMLRAQVASRARMRSIAGYGAFAQCARLSTVARSE